MSNTTADQPNWQAVVDAHPLESHVPKDWLRYGVALLQTMEPGPDVGKQLQQAALAFVQAQKEGASADAVATAQQHSVLISLRDALKLAGIDSKKLEPLKCASKPNGTPSTFSPAVKATTCSDADIAKAIATLADLYSLDLAGDANLKEKIVRAKEQIIQRGFALTSIRLALDHAQLAKDEFPQEAVEVLLARLA